MKKVLHVGCGHERIDAMTPGFQTGWQEIRLDINPDVRPDIIGTTTDMEAVADGSVDAVYSTHNVEHVHAHQVGDVLREFRRVLAPGGFAVIACPDIETVARHVAEGRLTEPLYMSAVGPISALDILYGHGAAIAAGEEHMAHRTAFTARTLAEAIKGAGFESVLIMRRPVLFDLWALAIKTRLPEEAARALAMAYLPAAVG